MNKYEAMFIVKPELSEDDRKTLLTQISDVIVKNSGKVLNADIWSEKRKLTFTIKKHLEGIYYLVSFNLPTEAMTKIKYAFKLNENILRVMILVV
jgi:small subunit ribosomal protein S6